MDDDTRRGRNREAQARLRARREAANRTTVKPRGDDIDVCGDCGQRHITRYGGQACVRHVVYDRESYVPGQDRRLLEAPRPCRAAPINGATVCVTHGGAERVKAAAKRRVAEAKVERSMRRFGGPIDTTPTEALLDAVRWSAGYVAWLRQRLDRNAEQPGTDTSIDAAIETKLAEWTDLLRKLCTDAIRNNIEERRVRAAEREGVQFADVIKAILADLNLTAEQAALVGEVVPLHLRRLLHVA